VEHVGAFDEMYSQTGRLSIPPEKLLRAQLTQMPYSVRSERLLMEEIDYSVLFRWFVGMNLDEPDCGVTVFTKNRDRLLDGDVARKLLCEVVKQAQEADQREHFAVDGTLVEAWASLKSFQPKDGKSTPPDDPGNPTVDFHGEKRSNQTRPMVTAERDAALVMLETATWRQSGDGGSRQGVRHERLCSGVPEHADNAARGAEPRAVGRQRYRRADHAASRIRGQPEEAEADRRELRLAEDDCVDAQGAASPDSQGGLGIHARRRGIQLGADAESAGQPGLSGKTHRKFM
jgi:transposase